jgi:hypothetical protein
MRFAMLYIILALVFLCVAFVLGCKLYHREYADYKEPVKLNVDYVLQVDEVGKFWDEKLAATALKDISDSIAKLNTIVVVFAHGWHHNAHPDNKNLNDFAKTAADLRAQLDEPLYAQSRLNLTGSAAVRVVAIYLGWRGRALPGCLDYLTFWSRRNAALTAGEGDIREFLHRLNEIYDVHGRLRLSRAKLPFMGLVAIGHSFGGQVVFRAVQSLFEQSLIRQTMTDQDDANPLPLKGFGDLVVLVNPAIDALQYDRIATLAKQMSFSDAQLPLLLTMSASNDSARNFWFPLGRFVDSIFRPRLREHARKLYRNSLGSYVPHVTHHVVLEGKGALDKGWKFDPAWYLEKVDSVRGVDLIGSPMFYTGDSSAGVGLLPVNGAKRSPFLVARADISVGEMAKEVIDGHSGIWTSGLRVFLNNYVAIVEGRKMLEGASSEQVPQDALPARGVPSP